MNPFTPRIVFRWHDGPDKGKHVRGLMVTGLANFAHPGLLICMSSTDLMLDRVIIVCRERPIYTWLLNLWRAIA